MSGIQGLSKAQQEVVDLLTDGWDLGVSMSMDGLCWLQRGGIGRGGASKTVSKATVSALCRKGVIRQVSRKFPTARYGLSESPEASK